MDVQMRGNQGAWMLIYHLEKLPASVRIAKFPNHPLTDRFRIQTFFFHLTQVIKAETHACLQGWS